MSIKKTVVLIFIAVAIAGVGVFNVFRSGSVEEDSPVNPVSPIITASSSGETVVTSPNLNYGFVKTSATSSKPVLPGIQVPNLAGPIVIPKQFPSDVALSAEKHLKETITALASAPGNATLWADLGFSRKGIEDYKGAAEAYEYALKLVPTNAIFADNLGVLYGDYLKDYSKAEQNFRLAITLDPKADYRYLRLFEFYRYSLKNIEKAKAVLEQGNKAIPGNPSFTTLIESLN